MIQEFIRCSSSPSYTSNFPACYQFGVTAVMGNVAHRKKELLNDSHHEAGFGDLGWSLERLKWLGDVCLATPVAETPSALCNVWN